MLISNYYRGVTDKLSGFVYDTEKKTYKKFVVKGKDWTDEYVQNGYIYSKIKSGWKEPSDISYTFSSKGDMELKLCEIKQLNFTEDKSMKLDFGLFKL